MGKTKRELTTFLNETFIPFGLKISRSAMLLEFSRKYVEFLNNDMVYSHPYVQCACGSDKVFNYGIPKNNGRYFYCRMCETAFKEPVYQREWNKIYSICGTENPTYDLWLEKYDHLLRESRDVPIIDLGPARGRQLRKIITTSLLKKFCGWRVFHSLPWSYTANQPDDQKL